MGCLYQLTFPNGKKYIGITKRDAAFRFKAHVRHAKSGLRLCAVHNAMNKYGFDRVKIRTLLVGDDEYVKYMEPRAIAAFSTKSPSGYNLTDGGEGAFGVVRSAETRKKMSDVKKGINNQTPEHLARLKVINTGRIHTLESRTKMSDALKGKKRTSAQVEQMRIRNTGKKLSVEARAKVSAFNKGKVFSDETRAKISAACLAKWVDRKVANEGKKSNVARIEKIKWATAGSKRSDETRAKIGKASKASWDRRKAADTPPVARK